MWNYIGYGCKYVGKFVCMCRSNVGASIVGECLYIVIYGLNAGVSM